MAHPLMRTTLRRRAHQSAQLGDLVEAAFDAAAHYSADPREVSRLATGAVMNILRRAGRAALLLPASDTYPEAADQSVA